MKDKTRRILSLVLTFGLILQQVSFAQVAADLNIAGYLSRIGSSMVQDKFRPLRLRYFYYDSLNDNFKVLIDKGDLKNVRAPELENSTKALLGYFLVGVALPDSMFWVNLRPDSEDQIIDPYLENTDVGKIMLEADLQLKKDTALFTSPQTPEGMEYWDKLYKKANEIFGYDNVTIPTLTRPWIVPGEIIVRESQDSAYVYKATLKVMLEQDYLKGSATYNFKDERSKALNEYSSQLIRELIIPKLTKEVNSGKRYAALRQVYFSLILSRWFKLRFTGKTGTYASLIDSRNLSDLNSQKAWSKTDYFRQYSKSFKDGEYNIKEPVYTPTGQVIRSYFSGGINVTSSAIDTQNGIILTNDNTYRLGDIVGGKAVVNPQNISLRPVVSSPAAIKKVLAASLITAGFLQPSLSESKMDAQTPASQVQPVDSKVTQEINRLIKQLSNPRSEYRLPADIDAVITSLVKIGEPTIEPLLGSLSNPDLHVRSGAAQALGRISYYKIDAKGELAAIAKREKVLDYLIKSTSDSEPDVRSSVYFAIGRIGGPRAKEVLINALITDKKAGVGNALQTAGVGYQGPYGPTQWQFIDRLSDVLNNPDRSFRRMAALSLGEYTFGTDAVPVLLHALNDSDWEVSNAVIISLGKIGDQRAVEPLLTMLSRPETPEQVQLSILKAFGKITDSRTIEPLNRISNDSSRLFVIREAAQEALNTTSARIASAQLATHRDRASKGDSEALNNLASLASQGDYFAVERINELASQGITAPKKALRELDAAKFIEKASLGNNLAIQALHNLALQGNASAQKALQNLDVTKIAAQLQLYKANFPAMPDRSQESYDSLYYLAARGNSAAFDVLVKRASPGIWDSAAIKALGKLVSEDKNDAAKKFLRELDIVGGVNLQSNLLYGYAEQRNSEDYYILALQGNVSALSALVNRAQLEGSEAAVFTLDKLGSQGIAEAQKYLRELRITKLVDQSASRGYEPAVFALFSLAYNGNAAAQAAFQKFSGNIRIITQSQIEGVGLNWDNFVQKITAYGYNYARAETPRIIRVLGDLGEGEKGVMSHMFGTDFPKILPILQNAYNKSGSSPLEIQNQAMRPGGIDFRALPADIQPMGSFNGLNFGLPQLSEAQLSQINIGSEIQQLENMVQSGIIPSGQRIIELIAACVQKQEMDSRAGSLLLCLADIFKLEEGNASESSAELKEALAIIDSQS